MKKTDFIEQHQNDLQKLDQILGQFYDQSEQFSLEWRIDYQDENFCLFLLKSNGSYFNIYTKYFDRFLNSLLFDKMLKTWTKCEVKIHDQASYFINYSLDTKDVNIEHWFDYRRDFLYSVFICTFMQCDLKQVGDLFWTYINLVKLFNNPANNPLVISESSGLQLLKTIIDQSNENNWDSQLSNLCQKQLSKPDCTSLSFKNSYIVSQFNVDDCCKTKIMLDELRCRFDFNPILNQIEITLIIFEDSNYECNNDEGCYFANQGGELLNVTGFKISHKFSLKQIKKLLNNEEFDQIIDEYKKDQQRSKINEAIYNKF